MNYGEAEIEITDRVNGWIAAKGLSEHYEASLMPETQEGFRVFYNNFTKARAAVQFVDVVPMPANGATVSNQDETVRFRLSFESRKLRGEGGLYNLMDLVKRALIGYKITNAITAFSMVKYGLLEFEQNSWQPYLEFECKAVNVQDFDSAETFDGPIAGAVGPTVITTI